jgi:hypothetical protein
MGIKATVRVHCTECKTETMHRECRCIHCGNIFQPKTWSSARARIFSRRGPEKGLSKLMYMRAVHAEEQRKQRAAIPLLQLERGQK